MLPLPLWLARANPDACALILPDGTQQRYGALAAMVPTSGLQLLSGDAATIVGGLVATALGRGTAFPLPPTLTPEQRHLLVAQATAAAHPSLALIIATSGSTANPKGVRLPWRAVAAASRISGKALELRPGDAWLACLPPYHVGGAMIVYRCLRAGATTVLHDGFDAAAVAHDLSKRCITHLSLVPPMLLRLLDAGVTPPRSLRCVLVGGAALTQALFDRAVATGWPICPTYGMTETCAQATVNLRPGINWREGDVGCPLPGVQIACTNDGRLRIATPARMAGYLGETGETPEWLSTNDLGDVDDSGHVHVNGRADDVLISAGVNVQPLDVESRLAACPGVLEAAVTGLSDAVWGQIIAVAFEGALTEDALALWCRAHLPTASRPRRFLRVNGLPRTASGKLDRRALPALWSTMI